MLVSKGGFWALSLALISHSTLAAPKAVIISGGGTPSGNHHSQYLQTSALTEGLRTRLGDSSVEVFFGIGNQPGSVPVLADVHMRQKINGYEIDMMLPGAIRRNSEANDANVREYFKSLPSAVSNKDTFFVFVSDHGMPNEEGPAGYLDNCIDLWAFDPKTKQESPWAERCLSRSDLESLLPSQVSAKNVVYAMSQCFSGGFHRMSIKTDEANGRLSINPRVCGFTAAPEDLTASGCTPNADGPGYAGYERYFTKQMIGRDFITGSAIPSGPRATVREAHFAATLEDLTGDIPMSSSDFYLQEWAKLIESGKARLSAAADPASIRELLVQGSRLALDQAPPALAAGVQREFAERQEFVRKMSEQIETRWNEAGKLARESQLGDLRQFVAQTRERMRAISTELDGIYDEFSKIRREAFFPVWFQAVLEGKAGLTAEETQWELSEFGVFERDKGEFSKNYFIRNDLAFLYLADSSLAQRKSTYLNRRGGMLINYAIKSPDAQARAGFDRWIALQDKSDVLELQAEESETRYRYSRRILMMREQLGALYALMSVGAAEEQSAVSALRNCEMSQF